MIAFRELRGEDVGLLTDRLADDVEGGARITVGPARWWELVRTDPCRYGWIIEHHGETIGYLDAEQDTEPERWPGRGTPGGVVYLALLLFPAARGRGLARQVLHEALTLPELAAAPVLVAYVEPDNHPARRTLLGAGFLEHGTDPDGLVEHRRARAG